MRLDAQHLAGDVGGRRRALIGEAMALAARLAADRLATLAHGRGGRHRRGRRLDALGAGWR